MIGVPTTAGTGSEAQSYALISDADTHVKMACGDPRAAFRVALLDPELTLTQPAAVAAVDGLRCAVARRREPTSGPRGTPCRRPSRARPGVCSMAHYERVLQAPGRSRGARGDAAGRAPGRRRHRGLDARRDARLRQSAHRALRDHARRGDGLDAAPRRALEWRSGRRRLRGSSRRQRARDGGRARGRGPGRAARSPGRCGRTAADAACRRRGQEDLTALAADAGNSGQAQHNPRAFDAAGALALYEAAW